MMNVNHQYPKKNLLLYVELFYNKYAKKIKKMRPHCAKCKKCARTSPNAKKCGTCGKTQKVRDFCAAHNRIFPQGVLYS